MKWRFIDANRDGAVLVAAIRENGRIEWQSSGQTSGEFASGGFAPKASFSHQIELLELSLDLLSDE
jgi:hypothetical protein